ncbi:MAG: glycosyltransferase family 39 protein [Myxococcales bacterium]|nr:glycosyltransferase family 39 protein [Myxococcales bacterium]
MSDTKSTESAKVVPAGKSGDATFPFATARRALFIAGVAVGGLNGLLILSGAARAAGSAVTPLLWGVAAACFLAAFVVYLREPVVPRAGTGAEDTKPKAGGSVDTAGPSGPRSDAAAPELRGPGEGGVPREKEPLLRPGNPPRLLRGGLTAFVSCFFAFLLMARHGQLRWGVPIGAALMLVASFGVMDLLGGFDEPEERASGTTTLRALAPSLAGFLGTFFLFCVALGLATAGRGLPQLVWGLLVTLTFIANVVALYELGRSLGAWANDESGEDRPLLRRHGFWVVVLGAALYLPFMGSYALWDPWETHYGEVAREMLAKDDWISLWWAQDGWFWSKPVLDMWMQAIAMATLGVHYQPDKMLIGDGQQPVMHPEWAVRAPVVILTILALYLLYKGVAKTFGRRAAFLGALVLGTMPDWYFIAHQTMTDMPFVGAMTACMGLVLMGLRTDEAREARAYRVDIGRTRLAFSGWHLVFGAILVCALPQILYLLSRNIDFLWQPGARGFHAHWDEFRSGSGGGNCGLPGNEECRTTLPASIPHSTGPNPTALGAQIWRTVGAFEPALQALLWAALLGLLLYMNWGERRTRRLYYLAAWFFAAISTLGKGPAGFGLPVLVTLLYLASSRPGEDFFARLKRVVHEITQFEIVSGLLLIVPIVALPWYVAMYVRHGSPFTDRLIFHDMFNRAFHHVHDTNEGDDTSFRFYIWQLGYALFPWTGLAPFGLLWWLRRGTSKTDNDRADSSVLLCMWFVLGFALFSFMGTKFHHYIFPAVPPVAMLIGVLLDDLLGPARIARRGALAAYLGGLGGGLTLLVFGITRFANGSVFGAKAAGATADGQVATGVALAAAGLVLCGLSVKFFGCRELVGPATKPADPATFGYREPEGAVAKQAEPAPAGGPPVSAEAAEPADMLRAQSHASRLLAAGAVAAGLLLVLVSRDLIIKPENADQPGAIRLLHLFTYNYRRPWPDSLDFSAVLAALGGLAVLLSAALAWRAARPHVVAAVSALGVISALWGLDVYMTNTAPHWGQHEVIAAYYADRASPDEILVAYQMNWKGENFYTGNHIPAFVSSGSTFTNWLKQKREQGAKVMYFITEHGRIGGLKSEVQAKSYREVTDKVLCNKFVLVRAEL